MPAPDAVSRHERIAELVAERGFVSNDDLARLFGVTVQTARRDVNRMADAGLVARHHGGAGIVSSTRNLDYRARQSMNDDGKRAIARAVSAAIPDGSSLFLNIGTTTEAVARALLEHQDLTVVTNNLNVAMLLSHRSGFRVTVVGGQVRNRDGGILGPTAAAMIAEFRVDYGIIGTSGIDADGILLDYDDEEIAVARAILRHARQSFVVADHTKFDRRPMMRLAALSEVTALFTDRPPPAPLVALMAAENVRLVVAGGENRTER